MKSNSGNKETHAFFELLDYCVAEIIKKMGDLPVAEWRSTDYTALSSHLGKQTKVYLSENTLRRILGKLKTSERYYPQKATRDALAQFIGYRDWQELELVYKTTKKNSQATAENLADQKMLPVSAVKRARKSYRFVAILSILLVLGCAAAIILFKHGEQMHVKLVCTNPFGAVPHSATFRLEAMKGYSQDEKFQLDFLEEAMRSEISGKKEVTKFFKNPGVVYATLLHNGKAIDTVSVFMQTKGWVANSGNDTSRAFPVIGLKTLHPANIYVSPQQLDSAGLDTAKPFMVGFSYVKPSHISGDNFSFNCKIFSEKDRPGTQCVGTAILILGSKDKHVINLFRPSCSAFCDYKFSELRVLGSDKNLSNLAFNPEHGGDVTIRVANKVVSIYLDGKKVLTTQYKQSIGEVMGIKFVFNGIGKVVSPQLQDLKTKEIF
ncbi:hypothetical protein CA265_18715 [Sphingobacteriaceae bacterium GW460-11-11-14-LB5]|nr:hypothetical protein CA265_18715 [Sphingobacteriaceae bacterium GW460-11-11-14-LB5]